MHAELVHRKITRGFRLQSQLTIVKGLFSIKCESPRTKPHVEKPQNYFMIARYAYPLGLGCICYDVNQSDETYTNATRRYKLNTPRVPARTSTHMHKVEFYVRIIFEKQITGGRMPAITKRLSESVINLPCYLADTLMNMRFVKFYMKCK